jgi:hypothetical protein
VLLRRPPVENDHFSIVVGLRQPSIHKASIQPIHRTLYSPLNLVLSHLFGPRFAPEPFGLAINNLSNKYKKKTGKISKDPHISAHESESLLRGRALDLCHRAAEPGKVGRIGQFMGGGLCSI